MFQKPSSLRAWIFLLASSHFVFSLLVQIENYFTTRSAEEKWADAARFFLTLPFAQFETIAVCVVLVLLGYAFARNKVGIILIWILSFVLNLYLILDQLSYPLMGDHLRPSYYEGYEGSLAWVGIISSSVRVLLGLSFYMNVALLAIWSVWSFFVLWHHTPITLRFFSPKTWGGMAALYGLVTVFASGMASFPGLHENPNFILVQSALLPSQDQKPSVGFLPHYDQPVLGEPILSDEEKQKLTQFHETALKRKERPNIIFVVLESVGAKQILAGPGHSFDSTLTPNLARQAHRMAIFNSVYTVFPATIRAHIAMNTASVMTWGSVYDELMHPYVGFSLKKSFSDLGYRTAIFSAQNLDVENMRHFFKKLNYDHYFEPREEGKEAQKKYELNSWGMREDHVWERAFSWMQEETAKGRPIFLNFFTVGTHHPYSAPADFIGPPLEGNDVDKDRYRRALAYTDHVLGQMFSNLETSGLADNTLVILVGDHGEAFAEWHRGDRLHKNHLYDENVRDFVAVWDGRQSGGPIFSRRIASVTDIPATLLSLIKGAPLAVRGQSLFSKIFLPRIVFFHKNNSPEEWGLRDGRWKFISGKTDFHKAQLYDLESDPDEQRNLIETYPHLRDVYNPRIASWYVAMNSLFVGGLKDYHYVGGQNFRVADVMNPGPKTMSLGYRGDDGDFVEASVIRPWDQVQAKLRFVAYDEDAMLVFEWISPSGKVIKKHHPIDNDWTMYTSADDLGDELEVGQWELIVKEDSKKLLEKKFEVRE